ncbi:RnfH family protein [Ramlibacter rhizophilus]|uniref:UPF0125 protein EZ242_04135 n=1 Tax=Ramlibacter rhizophilus TaxID=1781167 RepID=A0A4Z0C418_9BURK|nr:RnfH family protein [Ramlibacter rhizophilus]TFZ04945.1 RnfH family protein [Ramlibacter rhizophilus]
MADAGRIRVTLAWSPGPREVQERVLSLPADSCVADALRASGEPAEADRASLQVFVWGRAAAPEQKLVEGDRVELLRALRVDPKVARRERFVRQGARGAGLFARKLVSEGVNDDSA